MVDAGHWPFAGYEYVEVQHKAIVLIVKIIRRLLRSCPSGVRSWPCCSRR